MSFKLPIDKKAQAVARFIYQVQKTMLLAANEERNQSGLTRSEIARKLGVHRSVVTKLINGEGNLTLRTIAELSWAMAREPQFEMTKAPTHVGDNFPARNNVELAQETKTYLVKREVSISRASTSTPNIARTREAKLHEAEGAR